MGRLGSRIALSALALSVLAASPALAQTPEPTPEWLTCPAELELDLRRDRERGREQARVREIAPSAGARTSQELADLARLPTLAYELYDVFDVGGDLAAAFEASSLQLVGFIHGDPGRDTERARPLRKDRDTKTFYGFVADEPGTGRRMIVFRGTLQPNEWVRNLQVRQRAFAPDTPDARVHAGFLAIFESLEFTPSAEGAAPIPFGDALGPLAAGGETVFVGHSLGAAIATLAGVEAARRAPGQAGSMHIATFASPRVGDEGFAALAAAVGRIDRACNQVDIVTNVPPSTRRIPYSHVGSTFALSSFDWPGLDNQIEQAGDQVLCWHSDRAYQYMLDERKDPAPLGACAQPPAPGE